MPPIRPSNAIRPTASPICCWRRRSRSSGGSRKPRLLRRAFWNYNLHSGTAGNFPASIARRRLPPRSARRSAPLGCRNNNLLFLHTRAAANVCFVAQRDMTQSISGSRGLAGSVGAPHIVPCLFFLIVNPTSSRPRPVRE